MVGSSDLNDGALKLANEDIPTDISFAKDAGKDVIKSMIMRDFEDTHKRTFEISSGETTFSTWCFGLDRDAGPLNSRVEDHWYTLSR